MALTLFEDWKKFGCMSKKWTSHSQNTEYNYF